MSDDERFDVRLERAQADGKISPLDADEVRRFGDFLEAMAEAGIRPAKPSEERTPAAAAKARAIYLDHYPEYATNLAVKQCTCSNAGVGATFGHLPFCPVARPVGGGFDG